MIRSLFVEVEDYLHQYFRVINEDEVLLLLNESNHSKRLDSVCDSDVRIGNP